MEAPKCNVTCEQISDYLYHYKLQRDQTTPDCQFQTSSLVIIFGWYGADLDKLEKCRQLYHSRGFDTLVVLGKLFPFLWPQNAIKVSTELNRILQERFSTYLHFIIHAFSIGAFLLTVYVQTSFGGEIQNILRKKTIGIFYDSLVVGELSNMMEGIVTRFGITGWRKAIFTCGLSSYFYVCQSCTVDMYKKYAKLFREAPLNVPTFLLASKNDPMSHYETLSANIKDLQARLTIFKTRIWDGSMHVSILKYHYTEYIELLDEFLQTVKTSTVTQPKSKL